MFVVSAAIGEMIIPLIVGKVFDYVGAISFLAEGCILCFAAFGAYLAVLLIGKGAASHRREGELAYKPHPGYWPIYLETQKIIWS